MTRRLAEVASYVGVSEATVSRVLNGKPGISDATRQAMQDVLGEIQDGTFAREWIAENRAGQENFQRLRAEGQGHQIEQEGKQLRSMMSWIDTEFEEG